MLTAHAVQVELTPQNVEPLQLLADQLQVAEVTRACVQYMVGLMETHLDLAVTMCASIRAAVEWSQGPHLGRGPCLVTSMSQ